MSIQCFVVWLSWFDITNKKCKVFDILLHHYEWSWFNKCGIPHLSEHITVINVKVIVFWDVMLYSLASRLGVCKSCVPDHHGVQILCVSLQYGTCLMSPFWHLKFWGDSYIFVNPSSRYHCFVGTHYPWLHARG